MISTPLLVTKFGRAKIDSNGYYRITSRKEGNHRKLLHRLIFESIHGEIPEGYCVHHIDGDRLNNCIMNLELLSSSFHKSIHTKGNHELHRKISLSRNTIGFRNVSIVKRDDYKQGFTYCYRYSDNGVQKSLKCVRLDGLKEKVLAKGLAWEEFKKVEA